MKRGGEFKGTFNFPQKIRYFSAVIYNYKCIQHIKLPEEPLKHLMARISLFENSDRLACLIDTEKNGIILNDQVLHYEKGITFCIMKKELLMMKKLIKLWNILLAKVFFFMKVIEKVALMIYSNVMIWIIYKN